jgi:hypothetical protein
VAEGLRQRGGVRLQETTGERVPEIGAEGESEQSRVLDVLTKHIR